MTDPDGRFVTPPLALVPALGGSSRTREDLVSALSGRMGVTVSAPASAPTVALFVGLLVPLAEVIRQDDGTSQLQSLAIDVVERAMGAVDEEGVYRILDDLGAVPPPSDGLSWTAARAADRGFLFRELVNALVYALERWPWPAGGNAIEPQCQLFGDSAPAPRLIVSRGRVDRTANRPPRRRTA